MQPQTAYHKLRIRILYFIILGYASYCLCRQNFNVIIPAIVKEFGYTKIQIGWILTLSSVTYGIGKFINGCLSDKSDARFFISIGLLCSGVITVILSFVDNILLLGGLWIINSWFQSMGWPAVARILTNWFPPSELGTKWAYGSTSHQIGGAITLLICGYLIANFSWRSAFFIPGLAAILVSYLLFYNLYESPKILGLSINLYDEEPRLKQEIDRNLSTAATIYYFCRNKNIRHVCFANMCLYTVRLGILFWGPLFLSEYKNISLIQVGLQVAFYEIAGIFGGIAAGLISDNISNLRRGIIGAGFMLTATFLLTAFWLIPGEFRLLNILIFALIGFFIYGQQILVGVVSAKLAAGRFVGTVNGLIGVTGYLGAAMSGICVAWLSEQYGWDKVLIFFITTAFLGAIFWFLSDKAVKYITPPTSE